MASPYSAFIRPLATPALRRFAWSVLVYFVAVILWGALVRATGSGAGCGEHWPLCNGTVLQHSARLDTLIELTHRITSGLSLCFVLVLLVCTFAGTAQGHLSRLFSFAAAVFTLIEAVLGALIVKLGLTAQSHSPLRPAYLALHLANTLLLLASLTLAAHFLGRSAGYLRGEVRLRTPFPALAAIAALMVVGVTGSLAALGDTLFPASSLGAAFAQDISAASGWLLRWRWMHPAAAILAGVVLIPLLVRAMRPPSRGSSANRRLSALVLALLVVVCSLGLVDVLLLAPVWIQIAHLMAADALWISLVVLAARLTMEAGPPARP